MASEKNAVVIVCDRVGAGFLGPYGNTWIDTPSVNRLASQSMVAEFCLTDTPQLDRAYHSLWTGAHGMVDSNSSQSLPQMLSAAGIESTLLTDDPSIAQHKHAGDFQEVALAESQAGAHSKEAIEETQLAELIVLAIDWLSRAGTPFLLWIHAQAMQGSWDAPLALRQSFADEDDPDPPNLTKPPEVVLGKDSDPDEALGYQQAYAGQMLNLDACLGALFAALEDTPPPGETMLCLTSPRGYPLGEHGVVGSTGPLHSEVLHVPLMIKAPGAPPDRLQSLCHPSDMCATLAHWFDQPALSPEWSRNLLASPSPSQGYVCGVADGERSIRTPSWHMRTRGDQTQLFAKPDDRWEVNDVAALCINEVQSLTETLTAFEKAAAANDPNQSPTLSESLASSHH